MSTLSFGERVVRRAWRMTPKRALSAVIGFGARHSPGGPFRTPFLKAFAERFQIDVSEAEKPLNEYSGLQEFFTRRLKEGARPVDSASDVVVASADGAAVEAGVVTAGKLIAAKESAFTLSELLADPDAASRLEGGEYLITYLSPRDYHRVHTPVGGHVVAWHHVPGLLFPVNAQSVLREPSLFAINERFVTILEGEFGLCAVIMVAAVGVGHITASYDAEVATHQSGFSRGEVRHKQFGAPLPIARGGEIGIFHLGSTSIVIFERNRVKLNKIDSGSSLRMGQAIGRACT